MPNARTAVAHPSIWTILYLPFGAMSGFVTVALTYLATKSGLSITEASLLAGAQLVSQWLKWTWAPMVDVTLTPKRWYVIGTTTSALGVFAMSAIPLSQSTLMWLLLVIAGSSLLNSIVGMAIEAIMAASTKPEEHGRTSAWFQAGNLGGAGLGGGLGLTLLETLPATWMAGAVLGVLFMACCGALLFVPNMGGRRVAGGALAATRAVFADLRELARTKGGTLSAFLCFLPLGTGAAQSVLTQSAIADQWGATALHVAAVQGYTSAAITALGCFVGGWLCGRMHPRTAYCAIGLLLAAIAIAMALSPRTVEMYIAWNLIYTLAVGLAYAAFTAVVLSAIGVKSGATKYNIFASLSNFPIWWLGLLLGRVADVSGASAMLYTEAVLGVVAVAAFALAVRGIARTRLADTLVEPDEPEESAPVAAAAA